MTTQAVQAIMAGKSQESDCDWESENDQLDIDLLLTGQSDTKWQKWSDFLIEI